MYCVFSRLLPMPLSSLVYRLPAPAAPRAGSEVYPPSPQPILFFPPWHAVPEGEQRGACSLTQPTQRALQLLPLVKARPSLCRAWCCRSWWWACGCGAWCWR